MKFRYHPYASARITGTRSQKGCLPRFFSPFLMVFGLTAFMLLMPAFTRHQTLFGLDCQLSQRFPKNVVRWCRPIMTYAGAAELPPDLVAALIWHESGGNPSIQSRSGAVGLMQIMPSDGLASGFQCKHGPCFAGRPTIKELENPDFNIQFGTRLLRELLKFHKGDMREALKSYGPHDAGYSYADTILAVYRQYGSH